MARGAGCVELAPATYGIMILDWNVAHVHKAKHLRGLMEEWIFTPPLIPIYLILIGITLLPSCSSWGREGET